MANNDKENKIEKFTKEAIGKTLNQFNKEIGIADLVEINKNQDRILNGILSQVNDENIEKTEKSNIITLDNSTDGIVELKEIQGDTNVNVSKIEEIPITHDIGDKEGNVFTLNEIPKGAINIGEIQGNTMVNCNKDDKKELVLMKDLSTQGDNNITITEGVDGGLVDVALEGNTLVNVSETKNSTAITKTYTVENSGNHIALQGDIDGNCRPVVTGNTLVNIAKGSIATPMEITQDGFDSVEIIEHDNYVTYKMINASKVSSVSRVNWSLQLQQDLVEGKTYTAILPMPLNTHNGYFRIRDNTTPVNYTSPNGVTCWSFTATANGNSRYCFYAYTTSDYSVGDTVIFNMPKKIIILEGDWADKPIPDYFEGLQSTFEDNLVTQEMIDSGEEVADNLGKYRVDYKSTREDGTVGNTKTLYLNSPLLEGDTIEEKDDGIYHVHRYTKVVLDGVSNSEMRKERNAEFNDDNTMLKVPYFREDIKEIAPSTKYDNSFCDKLCWKPDIPNKANDTPCYGRGNLYWRLMISIPVTTNSDEAINAYLQSNPLTFVLPLKTPQYELIEQSNLAIPSYANGHLDFNTAVPVEKVDFLSFSEELTYLYANTKYTIQFISDKAITTDITLGGTQLLAQSIVKRLNRISITTPETLVDNKLIIDGLGANISEVVVTDTDREFGYFEGMKSVGECEDLEVVSSNSDGSQSNTQTLTHEPLRAVGDVKDKYILIDDKWYIERNCSEVVLDGSEDERWGIQSSLTTDLCSQYYIKVDDSGKNLVLNYINDTFKKLGTKYDERADKEGMYTSWSGLYINIFNSKLSEISNSGIKQWLQSNPIRVVYQLASPAYEPIDYKPLEVYSDTTHITTNSTIPTNLTVKNHGFNCLLKPSTTYTISSNLGLNTVTTPSTLTEHCLRFMDTNTSDVTTMKNVLVLEGDWTTKADLIPANFSGIESAFEQELVTDENDVNYGKYKVDVKVIGKNVFDKNIEFLDGYFINDEDGTNTRLDGYCVSKDYFRIQPNTTYYGTNMGHIALYDKDKNFIRRHALWDSKKTFTTSSNAYYLRYQFSSNDDLNIIQLEEGDIATEYEPYKESNVTFYIDEPLRGVEDVKDKVYVKDDKVVVQRNCGSITLDGSDDEDWSMQRDIYGKYRVFNVRPIYNSHRYCQGYSKYFPNVTYGSLGYDYIGEGCGLENNNLRISIANAKLSSVTVVGFRQWLQQNPTTVLYKLAEPTYEEVEYSSNRLILDTFNNESFNNSTLFLDTNVSPKLSFKPLWEELVYVKSNTKYYIQFNAVGSGEVVINLGGTELTTEIVEGYNCIPITTPSESTNLMTISGQGITISEVVVSEVVCGGYYKGLQSCFEEHMENGKYKILLRGIALDGSKVNGIKLYINEPLRGIGNIKDRLCVKNGKLMVERNCTEIIINETNPYSISGNNSIYPSVLRIWLNSSDIPNVKNGEILCNILPCYSSMYRDAIGIACDYGFDIHLPLSTNSTLAEAREYLKNNPLKVVYQLAEPIYEEVTNEYGLPIIFEGYENGIVYIDSAVTPTTHIKYTSNNQLATTLSEAEEQNIATQEDINMNVITYMMDIDMMLTDMEMSNDISVMAVRRDNSNENMLDRMSEEDKKVYRDNTVVMLEKMITANVLDKEDIEGRIDMYYDKNRISEEQYKYLKSLL